jgi:GcrA cell cycle regulator
MVGEWPAEKVARLRVLWAEGLSTSLIGDKMGLSKSSVIGKVRRLKLPARPSPIRRNAAKVKPPELPVVAAPPPAEVLEVSKRQRGTGLLGGPTLPTAVALRVPPAAFKRPPSQPCCWPFGEPGTKQFRFCGDPAKPDKPYCPEHCALAYIPLKPREIADAA